MSNQKTLSQLASDALYVQSACNLTAVLRSSHEAAQTLARHPQCTGTGWINQHPIMRLYSDKIYSLTGNSGGGFAYAYDECSKLAEKDNK